MTGARVAWVFNLDAEFELADPEYRRSGRMRAEIRERAAGLLPRIRAATGEEPVFLDEGQGPATSWPPPTRGDAWSPTPRALALLRVAGVTPPPAPPVEVLRRVNHRAFAAELDVGGLPGARFVRTVDECEAVLSTAPERRWLLKRPFGFSGRQRKIVVPRELVATAHTWIAASMTQYGHGLMIEPLVDRVADFGSHGFISPEGEIARRSPVLLDCDDFGAFRGVRRAGSDDLPSEEREALAMAFDRAAAALRDAGYHGPFGIDAFRWRDDDGRLRFQPLSEVNARYSLGWW